MFDSTSRYARIEIITLPVLGDDGFVREIAYVRRRFIPPADDAITLAEHSVVQGDRIDLVTARYLGDPAQFWRVCDGNRVLRPADLTGEPGRTIRIALPEL